MSLLSHVNSPHGADLTPCFFFPVVYPAADQSLSSRLSDQSLSLVLTAPCRRTFANKKKIALAGHINVSKIKWFICQNNLKGALADAVFSIEIMSI
jgi:hypothetical protein